MYTFRLDENLCKHTSDKDVVFVCYYLQHSPFGDVLLCPVCMVVFEGRILQCSQGHAVCEACQLKLTECPHCRGVYVGTRNYVLEAVIAKLQRLRTTENLILGDEDDDSRETRSTNEAPEDALLSEATQSDAATSESAIAVKILAPKGKESM